MSAAQPAILSAAPRTARALCFDWAPGLLDTASLDALKDALSQPLGDELVGIGFSLVLACGAEKRIAALHDLPALSGKGVSVPSTPRPLWVLLRGDDRGELVHRTRAWSERVKSCLKLTQTTDVFAYREGRDLTGYVDGTENPAGAEAEQAAIVSGAGEGLDGSSFVAVQRWHHDLSRFQGLSAAKRDHVMGRRLSDNEEIEDAPPTAHVKRAAQEDYEPAAFMLRRSVPFSDATGDGLLFIAFGHSLNAFEAVLHRMLGLDDGLVDGLFSFSRPVDGAYYWCPPRNGDRLDLRALV